MNYLGGFLMLAAGVGLAVAMLGLALQLLDPVTGGAGLALAVVVGVAGADLVARWEVS
ncbi:hypothetical protein UFOVP37_84 [uncultured Caudovirales phage]|uniref:Uncharacterized protein n=1 Tax=uncultured Caudovirales phage TaxID=2100421 RepID=A0A6J5KNS6_9CAUD|nr:hypothetical protein UFOVP37_84 [uncultured Caudovirales phage]